MRTLRSQILVVLGSLLLAACAGVPVHQPMPNSVRDKLGTTDVLLPIQQSEVYVFVPMATAGAGFGLLGALVDVSIDSARTSKAETAVTPLRNALVDFSFDTTLQSELKTSLAQVTWLHPGNYSVVRDVSNDGLGKSLAASKAESVLFVVADYHLNNDGDAMLVTIGSVLMPNNDQLRALIPGKRDDKLKVALVNALYRNRLVFEAHVGATGNRDRNISEWSAANGTAARAALTMAVKKLVPVMLEDMQRAETDMAPPASAAKTTITLPDEATQCAVQPADAQCATSAVQISQDPDGQLLRFEDGSLKYLKQGNF